MVRATRIRAAALAALVSCCAAGIVSWAPWPGAAGAAEREPQMQTIVVAASDYGSRSVALGIGKLRRYRLPA